MTETTKPTSPHCESCGNENPGHDEGYTACCNELICYGGAEHTFGTETENTRACCWAHAETQGITEGWRH